MNQPETSGMGAGGKASFVALAGTLMFVVGVFLGPVGFFFVALGAFFVLASPVVWLLIVWDNRSDE
jgi:hypothetical protein